MIHPAALTTTYSGLTRELKNEITVGPASNHGDPRDDSNYRKYVGVWDTGATASVITKKIATELQLPPIGMIEVHHALGTDMAYQYYCDFVLPTNVRVQRLIVTEGVLTGADVLIGMDVICLGDFAITQPNGKTLFSFRTPSIAEIDFVKKTPGKASGKPGRNDLCYCGSGKKYKRCCQAKDEHAPM